MSWLFLSLDPAARHRPEQNLAVPFLPSRLDPQTGHFLSEAPVRHSEGGEIDGVLRVFGWQRTGDSDSCAARAVSMTVLHGAGVETKDEVEGARRILGRLRPLRTFHSGPVL